jgi:hypothetical protein
MRKFCLLLALVSVLMLSCATDHKTRPFLETNDLAALCQKTNGNLVFTAKTFVDKRDQQSFFGAVLPDGVIPIFICISNGTDSTFGVNDKNLKLELNLNANNSITLEITEKTPQHDSKGSLSPAVAFVSGTVALGIIPGILLANAVNNQASSGATEVIINMKNKKLSSGLLHPNDVKAGFLYFEKSKSLKLNTILSGRIQGELLDLGIGRKISIFSELLGL